MKLIIRTAIILLAALLVTGATLVVARSGFASALNQRNRPERSGQFQPPTGQNQQQPGQFPGGFREHGGDGHHGNRGPSLRGLAEVLKDLVLMGLVGGVVYLLSAKMGLWAKPDRTKRPDPSAEHVG